MIVRPEMAGGQSAPPNATSKKSVPFQMVNGQNDRLAGSVPVSGTKTSPSSFKENLAESIGQQDKSSVNYDKDGDHQVGFWDFVDVINPLQHLPVISMIYRDLTGDTMKPVSEIVGGALYGGPIGAAVSTASAIIKSGSEREESSAPPVAAFAQSDTALSSLPDLGSVIALADLRPGYLPYNV